MLLSSRRTFIKASTLASLSLGLAADALAETTLEVPSKNVLIFLFQGDSITDATVAATKTI